MKIYILVTAINGYLTTDIIANNIEISGIISLDVNNSNNINESYDYREYCNQKKIEYIGVQSYGLNNEEDIRKLSSLSIDLLLVLGWQRLIPEWLIRQCTIGVIGQHGSSWGIENGRGRSPQNWALILDEPKFYISIFWIEEGVDSGKVIDTKCFEYSSIDDIDSSYLKVNMLVAEMILENINNKRIFEKCGDIQNGNPQYLPKRTFEDGFIDWNRKAKDIYNFIRALTKPYPGAFTKCKNTTIHIWRAKYIKTSSSIWDSKRPGEILIKLPGEKLLIKCGQDLLCVDEYTLEEDITINQGDLCETGNYKQQLLGIIERHNKQGGGPVNKKILDSE